MTMLFLKIPAHRMEFGVKRSILARNECIACRFSCGIFVYSGHFQFGNDHCFFLSRKSIFRYICQIIRVHILTKSPLKSRFREFLGNCLTLLFSNHSVLRVFSEASIALQAGPYILYCGANFEDLESRMQMLFPPCCLIFPHLEGPKMPVRNWSHSCRNGFQATACTTGVCGTDGLCAGNHAQKIIGLERK